MFDSSGETTDPWGVPFSVARTIPFSIMPLKMVVLKSSLHTFIFRCVSYGMDGRLSKWSPVFLARFSAVNMGSEPLMH